MARNSAKCYKDRVSQQAMLAVSSDYVTVFSNLQQFFEHHSKLNQLKRLSY